MNITINKYIYKVYKLFFNKIYKNIYILYFNSIFIIKNRGTSKMENINTSNKTRIKKLYKL